MSMNDYSVRGRVFRTGNDYQAALRDEKRIELILKRYENADKNGKENILNVLNRGEVKFETLLGDDFLDEIEEIHAEYLSNTAVNDKGKKKRKLAGNKSIKNTANINKVASKQKKKAQARGIRTYALQQLNSPRIVSEFPAESQAGNSHNSEFVELISRGRGSQRV